MPLILRAATVVLLLLASGCVQEVPAVADPDPAPSRDELYANIRGLLSDVPCDVPSVGSTTSTYLKLLHEPELEPGSSAEVDARGPWLLSVSGQNVRLVNITNPLEAAVAGTFDAGVHVYDVKFSPDNLTAIVAVRGGLKLVDIRNPDDLAEVGAWSFPSGTLSGLNPSQNAHMVFAANISGQAYVFVAPNTNTGIWILKLTGAPDKRALAFVSQTLPVQGGPLGPHDMYAQLDPDVKKWILYSADGYHGWSAWDVSDPTKPTLLGGAIKPESGYTHTVQAAKIGNRRIVATIAEVGLNLLEVYDATDLAKPLLLAAWHVQPEPRAQHIPQHNFNIVEGRLYMAHYTYGLFVFNLTKLGNEPVIGSSSFAPVARYAGSGGTSPLGFGDFWDVVVHDGLLYASGGRGIHVIGFGCLKPGDEALRSTG